MSKTTVATIVTALLSAAALTLSGCSATTPSKSNEAKPKATGSAATAASLLPEQYADGITVVTTAGISPPWSYHPDGKPDVFAGIDPELARAIADQLGVPVNFAGLDFAGMIPAVQSGRYDLAMFGISDTVARQGQVDMIDYVTDAQTIIVAKGNPEKIKSLDDLCGKSVALVAGTAQAAIVNAQSSKCSKPIQINTFPTKAEAFLQLQTGRAIASMDGYAVSMYLVDHPVEASKGLEPVPNVRISPQPLGIVVSKDAPKLRDAVKAALDELVQNGSYKKVLDKWGAGGLATDPITINGATK